MATVLVEGFDSDALALARFLAMRATTLSRRQQCGASRSAGARELGIKVERRRRSHQDPGAADVAYLDVWTPEVALASRVCGRGEAASRASATCCSSAGRDRRSGSPARRARRPRRHLSPRCSGASGIDVAVSAGARAGNLWPTADLLAQLEAGDSAGTLLLELTSSHLAFMSTSPGLAAVVSFWPDHLELHGGLEGYRAAKETIVRHQRPGDTLVFNADDASATFARATRADLVAFSMRAQVARGAYLEPDGASSLVDRGETTLLGDLPETPHPANVVAAAAIAAAAGAGPQAIAWGIADAAAPLPYRACPVGTVGGVPVIDDGMAATPGKTAATLAAYPNGSVVLIAGGMLELGAGSVHAMPEEVKAARGCGRRGGPCRTARRLFGPAASGSSRCSMSVALEHFEPALSMRRWRLPPPISKARERWCSRRCSLSRSRIGAGSQGSSPACRSRR